MQRHRYLSGALALCLLHACVPAKPAQPSTAETAGGEGGLRFGASTRPKLIATDATSAADVTTTAVGDGGYRLVCFQAIMLNTTTPVGVFEIQGSLTGVTTEYGAIRLDEHRVYGANFATFAGGTQVSVSSPAGTVNMIACVENALPYMRVFYDRTSGGAAATLDVYYFTRAN